jgi:hypothetical protein
MKRKARTALDIAWFLIIALSLVASIAFVRLSRPHSGTYQHEHSTNK